ncbi:hypothetical protein J2T56_001950 [Natronobacillus azotifigens]|uniref:Uncharacterized protein n=1 Tax=Natronobacillus azotifigens TaxID=472978 RepID=A0A9J6RDG0_9BACI|nr:hypothetical protein [Natronobacillus azotifigens]MCZ0703712.1 hypothetical protein [Natronobacillus azotifigens]
MYKQECYKIFTRKSLYFAFLLFVLFMVILPGGSTPIIQTDEYQTLYEEWRGPLSRTEIDLANQKLEELQNRIDQEMEQTEDLEVVFPPQSIEEQAAFRVYSSVASIGRYIDSFQQRKEDLQEATRGSTTTAYESEEARLELNMLNELGQPFGFYNTTAWGNTVDFINVFAFIILTILIVLGLSPVFADEHSQKSISLIRSTKHGKRKIVTTKILASCTYIVSLFVTLHIINVALEVRKFGALMDGTVPLQNLFLFIQSPFSLTIWQYYAIALGIQFFASLVIGLLVLFLSIVTRNGMLTFFISGAVIGTPFLFRQLGIDQPFIQYVTQFSYAELMRVKGLFDQFVAFPLFDQPVLYPVLLISTFLLVAILTMYLIYHQYKNQQIMN